MFPAAGGEDGMRNLLNELTTGAIYRYKVQTTMRTSYVHHYRQMIPIIISSLRFKSNNTKHKPVIKGIDLIEKYQYSSKTVFPTDEEVPIKDVVRSEWMTFVIQKNSINRANYELALLDALRSRLRCKEIWVRNAFKYGDPDHDLPQDFEKNRRFYVEKIGVDGSSERFIKNLKLSMRKSLEMLNTNMKSNDKVKILPKKGGWISISPFEAQPVVHRLIYACETI